LFHGLTPQETTDALYRLNAVCKLYRKGEIVVHAGLEANRLMAVSSGHLHVYASAGDREHPVLVREIGVDEVLGLWILHMPEVACWPGTVVAVEDSVLVSLDLERFRGVVASSERHFARMTANSAKILSRELFSTWRKLMVMDAPTIEAKVKTYLSVLNSEGGHTGTVTVPFDRERMAEFLGVTRPSLSRAIGRLRDAGLLSWRKNVFKIKF
jgi:CRP-like cAMP-binding protein